MIAPTSDRRVIVTMVTAQLAACLGYFSVMAHLVAHLRHDVGLMAGTIGLILGVRLGVQYALLLPVGPLTDVLGARRTGTIACLLRALSFALLGTAEGLSTLLCAAVLMGAGGALLHPAAQTMLAGVTPARRSTGFAAYVATQHIGTVVGPPLGLALLTLGFAFVAGTAAILWAFAGVLYLFLPRHNQNSAPRNLLAGIQAAFRDRAFLLFALATAPTTLLANHIMTAVPLLGFTPSTATLCFCVLAAVAAAAQPFVAAKHRGERPWVLRLGLLCAAATFLVLASLDGTEIDLLMLAAVLNGIANGLIQPSIFQRAARHAPQGRFGSYYGVLAFCSGMFACVGDLVIGRLFDQGTTGATTALLAVAAFALAAAMTTRGP